VDALWAIRLTSKGSAIWSPYTLVYGKEARMPMHLELNAVAIATKTEDIEEYSSLQALYNQLM
jgi:hypothetical protein